MQIAAGEFKAKCLKLMEDVKEYHEEVIITKFGKPIAKLVPFESESPKSIFGYLKGEVEIKGDIVKSTGVKWNANE